LESNGTAHTCNVAEELFVRARCKQRHPMVLPTSRRNRTCEFAYADENREIAEPYDEEAVYETSRAATVLFRPIVNACYGVATHFWNPVAKILFIH
jgi:hypothetical protein